MLTSHNPLTITALSRDKVRVIARTDDGRMTAAAPYADPRGMGFTATLTEIFGLATTYRDVETEHLVDERDAACADAKRDDGQQRRLIELNDQLARLGFLNEDREPLAKTSCGPGTTCATPTGRRSPRLTLKRGSAQ